MFCVFTYHWHQHFGHLAALFEAFLSPCLHSVEQESYAADSTSPYWFIVFCSVITLNDQRFEQEEQTWKVLRQGVTHAKGQSTDHSWHFLNVHEWVLRVVHDLSASDVKNPFVEGR